jgi:hypothetical protein
MTVQLVLLKSGETLIADAKEMVSSDEKVCGYIFKEPFMVLAQTPPSSLLLLEEDEISNASPQNKETKVNVTLTPWIPFTEDKDIMLPLDWVVTIVNPVATLKEMYEERSNGKQND